MPELFTSRSGVPYSPTGDVRERYENGRIVERTEVVNVAWDRYQDFREDLLPDMAEGAVIDPLGILLTHFMAPVIIRVPFYTLNRTLPQHHPDMRWLYVSNIELTRGLGFATTEPTALGFQRLGFSEHSGAGPRVQVTVTWTYPTYKVETDAVVYGTNLPDINLPSEILRYVTCRIKPAVKDLPVRGRRLQFVATPPGATAATNLEPLQDTATIPLTSCHFSMTWHMVPRVPPAASLFMGYVNSQNFFLPRASQFRTIDSVNGNLYPERILPTGTVLYLYPEVSEVGATVSGAEVWDVTYHFLYRPQGHNRFFRAAEGSFRRAYMYAADPSVTLFDANPGVDPPTGNNNNQTGPGRNAHDYANLNSLFRLH